MTRMPALYGTLAACLLLLGVFLAGCDGTPVLPQENGSVRVLSSPPGAAIYLDDEYRGTTPATVSAVPAGSHTLVLRADGYERWSGPVTVRAGSMANVSATLAALPATPVPVTFATVTAPAAQKGQPEIHIDGYWSYPPGVGSTENPVPLIVHANGFNTGDADAREVTASVKLYYGGREICWKTVYFGTLKAGGHVATDTMVSCMLPSGMKAGDLTIRFDNVVVTA